MLCIEGFTVADSSHTSLVVPVMLTFAGIDPLMVQLIQSRVGAALLKDCAAAAALNGASEAVVPAAAAAAAAGAGHR
jgi:hypothetical protein